MSIEEFGAGQRWGPITYAQHGDDLFIINLFELMAIENPSYLDIGANHPFIISNTALLYKRGSRGINVEANPNLMQAFYDHRPEDVNVNLGIAPTNGKLEYYMFDVDGWNTFSKSERDKTIANGYPVKETKLIEVITINELLDRCCVKWPDLLSIDCEGLDYQILESARFAGAGPKIICVETRRNETYQMYDLLKAQGYDLITRLAENLIFVKEGSLNIFRPPPLK